MFPDLGSPTEPKGRTISTLSRSPGLPHPLRRSPVLPWGCPLPASHRARELSPRGVTPIREAVGQSPRALS